MPAVLTLAQGQGSSGFDDYLQTAAIILAAAGVIITPIRHSARRTRGRTTTP